MNKLVCDFIGDNIQDNDPLTTIQQIVQKIYEQSNSKEVINWINCYGFNYIVIFVDSIVIDPMSPIEVIKELCEIIKYIENGKNK